MAAAEKVKEADGEKAIAADQVNDVECVTCG